MSSAGRSHDGKPASPESSRLDEAAHANPAPSHERDQKAADGHGATATAVVSSGATTTDDAAADNAATGKAATDKAASGKAATDSGKPSGLVKGVSGTVWRFLRRITEPTWVRHVLLVLIYIGAGVAATWPRFTYLADGKLPKTSDTASFVWGMWWIAHQVVHLGNPFFTKYMAAPVGAQLGFSTLMPLAGFVMLPVTLLWGPSAAYTVLSLIVPGLLCYAMFRAARLWLNVPGSIAAGAFFGLSSMMLWQVWYHVNIAAGLIFLPVVIEAAVRLRRSQKMAPAIWLGIALGATVMTSQEGAAIALLIAIVIMVPWIVGKLVRDRASLRRALLPLGIGAVVAFVVASPQLIAMTQQIVAGGAKVPVGTLAVNYTQFGVPLQTQFSPSPRLTYYGLGQIGSGYAYNATKAFGTSVQPAEGLPTFGIVASALALIGVVIGWRKRATWWFLLLWIGCAALALGTSVVIGSSCVVNQVQPGTVFGRSCHQYLPLISHIHWTFVHHIDVVGWQPVAVSNLMPYTWLVRIPGLAGLREADRFMLVGMIGVALLAGFVVDWLSKRRRWLAVPLIAVVVALGVFETGWAGGTVGPPARPTETMATTMPAFDAALRADHSHSVVVDVPFGLRGGLSLIGASISERTFLLATEDQHPRAASYTAWVPLPTIKAIEAHPFYLYLMKYQSSRTYPTRPQLAAAAADLKTLHIGWVIEWANMWRVQHHPLRRLWRLETYLHELGFRRSGLTCLVPSKPGTICGGHPLERVRLLRYVRRDAYTNATPIRVNP